MKRNRIINKVCRILQAALCVLLTALLCLGAIDIYREGSARKAEHPMAAIYTREGVAERLSPLAPLLLASLGLTAAGLLLGARDGKAAKSAGVAERNHPRIACAAGPAEKRRNPGVLRALIIAAAIAFIVAGIFNGSARDVLYKAANICSECIGLG